MLQSWPGVSFYTSWNTKAIHSYPFVEHNFRIKSGLVPEFFFCTEKNICVRWMHFEAQIAVRHSGNMRANQFGRALSLGVHKMAKNAKTIHQLDPKFGKN